MYTTFSARTTKYFATLLLAAIGLFFYLWYFGMEDFGLVGARDQRLAEAKLRLEVKADYQSALIANGLRERRGDILSLGTR